MRTKHWTRFNISAIAALALAGTVIGDNSQAADSPSPSSGAAGKKPNILIIWGDHIGMWNVGAHHRGMMAGRTPNLDKL